jgi:hypothetical protein
MIRSVLRSAMALIILAGVAAAMSTGCGSGNDSGGGGSAGSTGSTSMTESCNDYCSAVMTNCKGAEAQYSGMDQCKNSCAAFPAGKAGDQAGDSVQCRAYHANAAAMDAATHCPHAGPGGGDGVCGAACDGFCDIAMKYCTAENMAKVYDTRTACETDCKSKNANAGGFNASDASLQEGASQSCLLYHVQEGSVVPADHCTGDVAPGNTCG